MTVLTATPDEQLMAAYQAGTRDAFDELFARYRDPIRKFFGRRLASPQLAEELVQDTFMAVLRGAERYEPRASFRSYLFGVAFNVLSAARRSNRHVTHPIVSDPAAPDRDPVAVLWVRRALADLDADDREVLVLREYDGLSYNEMATVLAIPLNTVKIRLFRAREALRARLTDTPEEGAAS